MCNQRRERHPDFPPSSFSTRSMARKITFFLCRFGNQCLLWWLVVKLKTTSFECYAQMCNQRRERYPNLPPSIFSTRSMARNITTCSSLWQSMITVNTCCVKWAKSTLFLLALHRNQFLMPWKICFISWSTMQHALLTCFLIKSKKSVMQSMQSMQRGWYARHSVVSGKNLHDSN